MPRNDGGELDTALAFLSFARSCVLKKVAGLNEEQLRRRLVVSDTTLLGLVQHLTDGERYWFGYTFTGDQRYADADFDMVVEPDRSPEQIIAGYRAAIADSDAHIGAAAGLDLPTAQPVGDVPRTLRWVLAHMTSETTRHAATPTSCGSSSTVPPAGRRPRRRDAAAQARPRSGERLRVEADATPFGHPEHPSAVTRGLAQVQGEARRLEPQVQVAPLQVPARLP